jgi:acyl-CoA reductase-like NAD-dependent aldehyde dehydrogenase
VRAFVDGDSVCVVGDDFTNLQESEAVFLRASAEDLERLRALAGRDARARFREAAREAGELLAQAQRICEAHADEDPMGAFFEAGGAIDEARGILGVD